MMKKFLMTSKIHRILFFPVLTKKNMLPHTLEMSTHTLRDREKSDEKRYANEQDEEKLRVLREKMKKIEKDKVSSSSISPSSPSSPSSQSIPSHSSK